VKIIALFVILIMISGCGTNNTIRKADSVGTNRLYVNLAKKNDRFIISNINSTNGTYLLNDLSPQFDVNEQPCGRWRFGSPSTTESIKCDYTEEHFRYVATDKPQTTLWFLMSWGLYGLFGIQYKYSYFDADKHWEGINSALTYSNIDRKIFLNDYDLLTDKINKYNNTFMSLSNSQYIKPLDYKVNTDPVNFNAEINNYNSAIDSYILAANSYDKYLTNLSKKVNDVDSLSIKYKNGLGRTTIEVKVDDKSGFYDNSIDFKKFIIINANPLTKFEYRPNTISLNASDYKPFSNDVEQKLREHAEALRKLRASYMVTINSSKSDSCYNYKIDYPETVDYSESDIKVKVKAIVESKDFRKVIPNYENKDNLIRVKLSGNQISINNKATEFVRVISVGYYYDTKVYTDSSSEIDGLEIAPESTSTITIPSQFFNIVPDKTDMTAAMARNQSINFGLALKYRVVNQNVDKTLYKKFDYNLYDVLKARNFSCSL